MAITLKIELEVIHNRLKMNSGTRQWPWKLWPYKPMEPEHWKSCRITRNLSTASVSIKSIIRPKTLLRDTKAWLIAKGITQIEVLISMRLLSLLPSLSLYGFSCLW